MACDIVLLEQNMLYVYIIQIGPKIGYHVSITLTILSCDSPMIPSFVHASLADETREALVLGSIEFCGVQMQIPMKNTPGCTVGKSR